jgi:hypothetical protein
MLTTAPGPTFMQNDGQSGARSADHTQASCARLLDRAQKAGTVRAGVTASEVIALAVGLAWAAQQPGAPSDSMTRLLATAMYGLAVPV